MQTFNKCCIRINQPIGPIKEPYSLSYITANIQFSLLIYNVENYGITKEEIKKIFVKIKNWPVTEISKILSLSQRGIYSVLARNNIFD